MTRRSFLTAAASALPLLWWGGLHSWPWTDKTPVAGQTAPVDPSSKNPTHLEMDRLNIDAAIEPLATNPSTGALDTPDYGQAGWYAAGPKPGSVGRAEAAVAVPRRRTFKRQQGKRYADRSHRIFCRSSRNFGTLHRAAAAKAKKQPRASLYARHKSGGCRKLPRSESEIGAGGGSQDHRALLGAGRSSHRRLVLGLYGVNDLPSNQ